MLSVEKVATPATAATVVVPRSVAPLVPVPDAMATVTFPANEVTIFPDASCAVTCTAGVIAAPATVFTGGTVKATLVAVPTVTLNAALVAVGSDEALAVSVYPMPALSILSAENVATPATAATLVVPDSVPPLGLVPIAMVMVPVKPVATLPS